MTLTEASPKVFQPYGFLLTGGRRGSQNSASASASPSASGLPTPRSATTPVDRATSETEHGKALADHLDFIVPPAIAPTDVEQPTSARGLFIGHLRFETTAAEVRWLIKKLCGVNPLRADIRGNGCCVVYLATEADALAVRGLSRRVLFDHNGFWFARTADAVDTLLQYVEHEIPKKKKSLRLPRDAVVVEESRSAKHFRRNNANGNNNHNSTPSNNPQHQQHRQHHHAGAPQQPVQPLLPEHLHQQAHFGGAHHGGHVHGRSPFAAGTPMRSPMSPCNIGSPMLRNFHESPPDYVHPPTEPSALHSSTTSPMSRSSLPPMYGYDMPPLY